MRSGQRLRVRALIAVALLTCSGLAWAQAGEPPGADARRPIDGYGLRPFRAAPEATPPARPAGKAAYAGLGLRQNPEGVVVAGVQPGPFGGDGSRSPSIWRGDLIVAMN